MGKSVMEKLKKCRKLLFRYAAVSLKNQKIVLVNVMFTKVAEPDPKLKKG